VQAAVSALSSAVAPSGGGGGGGGMGGGDALSAAVAEYAVHAEAVLESALRAFAARLELRLRPAPKTKVD
jgi:hypothetical protein